MSYRGSDIEGRYFFESDSPIEKPISDSYQLSITGTFIGSAKLRSALTEIKGEECSNKNVYLSLSCHTILYMYDSSQQVSLTTVLNGNNCSPVSYQCFFVCYYY